MTFYSLLVGSPLDISTPEESDGPAQQLGLSFFHLQVSEVLGRMWGERREVETLRGSVETWIEGTRYRSGLPCGDAMVLRAKRDQHEAQWGGRWTALRWLLVTRLKTGRKGPEFPSIHGTQLVRWRSKS
jgi:hypothetical protein